MWRALWTTHPAPVPKAAELPRRSPGVCASPSAGAPLCFCRRRGPRPPGSELLCPGAASGLPRAPRPKRSLETRAPRAPGHPGPRRALAALLTRDLWAGAHPPPPCLMSPSWARLPCASPHAVRPCLFETPAGSRTARSSRSAARWLCHAARAVALSPPSPLIRQCPPRRRAASEPREGTRASFLLDGGVCTPGGVRVSVLREVLAFERVKVGGHPSVGFREPPRAGAGGSRGPVGRAEGLGTEPLAGSCSQTARGAAKG